METFSQNDPNIVIDPNSSPNCFFCHDTKKIVDGGVTLLGPTKINVSHILSRYLLNAPSPPALPPPP
jgi:hypothetical protein